MSIINEDGTIKEYEYDCAYAPSYLLTKSCLRLSC